MSFLAGGLTVMLVALVVRGVLAVLHRPRQAKTQTVVWSKLMLVIGILGCTLWLALALWALFDGQSPWVPILCLGMSFLLGGDMIVGYFNCRVTYGEDRFSAKSFWGVKRIYTYDQITGIRGTNKSRTIRLYLGKRVVKLEDFSVGRAQFLSFAKKQYRKNHDGETIPPAPLKLDLFHGNLEDPGGTVIVLVGGALLALVMVIVTAGWEFSYLERTSEVGVSTSTLSFQSYERKGEDLLLYTQDDPRPYKLCGGEEALQLETLFWKDFHNGDPFEVSFTTGGWWNSNTYRIRSLEGANGMTYLPREERDPETVRSGWQLVALFASFFVGWTGFTVAAVFVARNASRLNRRFVRFFFKEEAFCEGVLRDEQKHPPRKRRRR